MAAGRTPCRRCATSTPGCGLFSLMVTDDPDSVRALNARAQAFQFASDRLDLTRSTGLRDELCAAVGDVVVTRQNERRLPVNGGRDFVKIR
jgi:hypothetical protein